METESPPAVVAPPPIEDKLAEVFAEVIALDAKITELIGPPRRV